MPSKDFEEGFEVEYGIRTSLLDLFLPTTLCVQILSVKSMDYSGNLMRFFDGPFPLDYALSALRISGDSPICVFGETPQSGVITILNSSNEKILEHWEKQVRRGYIKKVQDIQLNGPVIEMVAQNPSIVFLTSPVALYQRLGIRLPVLIMVVKNLRKQFSFDLMILDDKNTRRRFRFSNRQTTTRIKAIISIIPLKMEEGWNILQIDLREIVNKSYGTNYKETLRLQINANCRLRRVAFSESSQPDPSADDQIPQDLKNFVAQTKEVLTTSDLSDPPDP